jgi:lipoprotein-releasing system permease protein
MSRFIAWRFMLKGTEEGNFSLMTLVAWIAIAIGVAAMSLLLSVMYGFEGALRTRFLNAYPHVMVQNGTQNIEGYTPWTEKLKGIKRVSRVLPFIEAEMVLQSAHRTLGGVVWGVGYADMGRLEEGISEGKLPDPKSPVPQVLIGKELGQRMGVFPGSKIKIISPIQRGGFLGKTPEIAVFEISGLYASGHYEFDQQYIYLPLEDAQDLLRMTHKVSGFHIWGGTLEDTEAIQQEVRKIVPSEWQVQDWKTFNTALFQSLQLEQYSMFIILSFAVFIAVLNIVITLLMHVSHKKKNIGILRALGASQKQIRHIFLWQGAWMGVVGLAAGAIFSAIGLIYLRYFSKFLLPEIYYDRTIPVEIRPASIFLIYFVAAVMVYLATLHPAKRASLLDPIEAIRE